jgi:hypothetical protein
LVYFLVVDSSNNVFIASVDFSLLTITSTKVAAVGTTVEALNLGASQIFSATSAVFSAVITKTVNTALIYYTGGASVNA